MFLQNYIIRLLGVCGFIQFGNRSWIGMPFNATNDSFPVHEEHTHKQEQEHENKEIAFDFNNKLSVV